MEALFHARALISSFRIIRITLTDSYCQTVPYNLNSLLLWTIAKPSAKSSPSSTLISDVPSGNLTQGGYIVPYKWETSALFAGVISTAFLTLYLSEIIHQPNWTLNIRILFHDYSPGRQIISAREIPTKSFAQRALQKCLEDQI